VSELEAGSTDEPLNGANPQPSESGSSEPRDSTAPSRHLTWRKVGVAAAVSIAVIGILVWLSFLWLGLQLRPEQSVRAQLDSALSRRGLFQPVNILVVGVDRGRKDTKRADTIMLVRIDGLRRKTWLLSIPRDTNVGLDSRRRVPAPACSAALAQATIKSSGRSKASDGIMASRRHNQKSPMSDHRWGRAFDLTHDPNHGIDCARIAESIRRSRDPRVEYVIFDGRYFSAREGWRWRPYQGDNPHSKHMHVSVSSKRLKDTSPWPGIMYDVDPTPVADALARFNSAPGRLDISDQPGMASLVTRKNVKANRAYSVGGPALMVDTVERLMNMPVHHYIEADFQGVTAAVDALGGITMDVPTEIRDRRAADASPNERASRIDAGEQVLDGEHALTFVRTRKYWDADFSRMNNQQAFIKAVLRRALSPAGIVRLPTLASVVDDHAMTDMTGPELLRLAAIALTIDSSHRTSETLTGRWRPPVVVTDQNRRSELIKAMNSGWDFTPQPHEVTVEVLNGSGRPGEARRVALELARQGLRVVRVDNAKTDTYESTQVVAREDDIHAASLVLRSLPSAESADSSEESFKARVLVVVGAE